jgi:hypothetical protein
MGIAAEKYPASFRSYALLALNALSVSVRIGENPDESRGSSTDNAVSAVGIILENMELQSGFAQPQDQLLQSMPFIWAQWLRYLPLRHDIVSFQLLSIYSMLLTFVYFYLIVRINE